MSQGQARTDLVVIIHGCCESMVGTAAAFGMLGWDVQAKCTDSEWESFGRRLAPFAFINAVRRYKASAATGQTPSAIVYCAAHSEFSGDVPVGTVEIELCGVRVEDDEGTWLSCADLITWMRSGQGMLTRVRGESGLQGPPYMPPGETLPALFLGLHAVLLALATLGTPHANKKVSVSAQECMLATLHNASVYWQVENRDTSRAFDPRPVGGRFQCLDGEVLFSLPAAHYWEKLIAVLGNPDWAMGGWWRDPEARFNARDIVEASLGAWCGERTVEQAFTQLQDGGVPAAYLATPKDVLANPQLASRQFVQASEDAPRFGVPLIVSAGDGVESPPSTRDARVETWLAGRQLGESDLPLSNLLICDFSWAWAGPNLTMHMGMLGATVVKIENEHRIDHHRLVAPYVEADAPKHERAAGHLLTNRNKLSLELDIKSDAGRRAVQEIIAQSDAIVDNFSPGTLDRLGLSFSDVCDIVGRRGFVYISLSGFGASGPWNRYRSMGMQLADLAGLSSLIGEPGLPPISMGIPFADPLAGTFGAAALLHYLRIARELERPLFLDVSQFETLVSAIPDAVVAGRRSGNQRSGDGAGTGVYACLDPDTWIAVRVRKSEELSRLLMMLEIDPRAHGEQFDGMVEARVAAWAAQRSAGPAAQTLRAIGIEATEVLSASDLLTDATLRASNFWVSGSSWIGPIIGPSVPWLMDGERVGRLEDAPRLGQHTDEVLGAMLGYSAAEIASLRPVSASDH